MSKETKCKSISVGGQALLEGIMMKGPKKTVMAVRMPDGSIDLEDLPEKHLKDKYKIFGSPVLRGGVNMVESFMIGYKALMRSAEKLGLEDDEEVKESWLGRLLGDKIMSVVGAIAMVLGLVLAVVLFMWLPTMLFNLLNSAVTPGASLTIGGLSVNGSLDGLKGLFEGVVKIMIFVGYVAATAFLSDIKRTYQYHGAEHKSIFCYEAGLPLTVENVRSQSRFHPRCGTSFLLLMLLVSILISSSLILIFPGLKEITWLWVTVKILLLPLICGLGYELIRFCGRHQNAVTKIIATPGLWMQRLTTKEPEDDMIEVAIASLKAVLPEYQQENGDNCSSQSDEEVILDLSDLPEVSDDCE
ncbi:MAG: DUF1385 domain-containing protein [Clostridia bacterium]|nr:DUF1385 domain-containing protein [Clostridia bacterium]